MKILARLEKGRDIWYLLTASVVFFLLRLPSLFEPNWYGDEGIYQVLGLGIRAGRLLYRDIFDNKPPLLYLLYALVNSDEFMIRLLSLVAGLLAVIIFYYLGKKLIENTKAVFIATLCFAVFFGLPLIEGNIANAENFMLPLNLLAGYLVLKSLDSKRLNTKYLILVFAGLTVGISFLLKIVAVFDFAAFAGFLFFANYPKHLFAIFKKEHLLNEARTLAPFVIAFFVPILLTAAFFVVKGATSDFMKAILFNNVGYVGYGNTFIIPQGFLIFKLILLAAFSLFVFFKRQTYGLAFAFISLWLAFALFNAFFSGRPYTHYVLVLLPAFCLTIGLFILNKNYSKLSGVLMLSVFILVLLNFGLYGKTPFYYQNFLSFISGGKSVADYQRFFDASTPRDYEIANFVDLYAKPQDNIFLWGNNAQVYDLTNKLPPGKYAVAYHIQSYSDGTTNTEAGLKTAKPKFIIVMPNVEKYPFPLVGYDTTIDLQGVTIYEKLY